MNKIYSIMAGAAVALGMVGCTDWDDHYSAEGGNTGDGSSLWETINSRPELSDFASLLKKSGYDELLASDQTFTVWAPVNSVLDAKMDSLNAVADSSLVDEFIKNHVSRTNYVASGAIDETVHLMNGKIKSFSGSGAYTMDGISVSVANIPVGNGSLHSISGNIPFEPNLYEYLFRSSQTSDIASYFNKYFTREIDTENSVQGPMLNGEITYLDTVYIESNELFERDMLNAMMDVEDSSYTMIVPTNNAWQKAIKREAAYFKYPSSVEIMNLANVDEFTNDTSIVKVGTTQPLDADSLQSYYSQLFVTRDLMFSHNIADNKRLLQTVNGLDSVVSTTEGVYKGENATDLFVGAVKSDMSNGSVYLTDTLRHKPWLGMCPIIRLRANNGNYQQGVYMATASNVHVVSSNQNPNVSGSLRSGYYYEVAASAERSQPRVYFTVPHLLSTKYAVYMTLAPANITDTTVTPSKVTVRAYAAIHDANGKITRNGKVSSSTFSSIGSNTTYDFGTRESAKILTKYVGTLDSKICYEGLDDYDCYPALSIRVTSRGNQAGMENNLRIEGLLFIPQEAIDYYGVDTSDELPESFWEMVSDRSEGITYSFR